MIVWKKCGTALAALAVLAVLTGCGKNATEDSTGGMEREQQQESGQPKQSEQNQASSTIPQIQWRLAEPVYEKKDDVVYGYSIADFGVEPGSGEDVSGKIQAALIYLNQAGGGTLYLPAGEYRLEKPINIPKGVTICGDWKEPIQEDKTVGGTVLAVYAGRGKGAATAQFILQPNSCIRDLTIWYPEQTADDIQEYPPTIQLYDPNVWGADYTHVRNITLVNSYIGVVQGPNGNGCPNVHNLYGTTLCKGLSMDGSADVGRCDYIHLSADYWVESGLFGDQDGDLVKEYLRENAVGITLGRVDWSYYANTWIEGYAVGLKLREGELTEKGNYPNGQVYRHTYTDCATGILVNGVSTAGEEFAEIRMEGCDVGVRVEDNLAAADGMLQFYDTIIDAESYGLYHEGEEDVLFLDSQINGGPVYAARASVLLLATEAAEGMSGSRVFSIRDASLPDLSPAPDMPEPVHKAAGKSVLYVYEDEISDETDQTTGIQKLLDQAKEEGGGIVFLPPGEYCIRGNLTVPEGVELKGAVDVGRNPIRLGTILRVREGADVQSATVTLCANSGINGIVFDYPEQDFTAPVPYPYALRGEGENIYVVNVSLRGAYDGLDLMSSRCDNHYVEYLSGICLHTGLQVGGGSTGGRIYNYQFNYISITAGDESKFGTWDNAPSGDTAEAEKAALEKYLQENLVVLRLGDVTDEIVYDNFSYNGLIGVQCVEENGKGPSGWNVGHGVDYSSRAFEIEGLGDMTFLNTQLVSFRNAAQVEEICHIALKGDVTAKFVNMTCWARPNTSNLLAQAGELLLWNMMVHDVPTVSVKAENGAVVGVTGAAYHNNGSFILGDVTAPAGASVNGVLYGSGMMKGEAALSGSHDRKERIDMPDNALYEGGGEMLLAEGFTNYPCVAGEDRYLDASGTFDQLSVPSAKAYAGLTEEDGATCCRLYCDETMSQTYMKSSSLVLEDEEYGLELRFRVKSIHQNPDYGILFTMTGRKNGQEAGNEILFGLYGDRELKLRGASLCPWQEDLWYRLKLEFNFDGPEKCYKVTLLDDEGGVLAQSGSLTLREELQDEGTTLGDLQIALIGSTVAGKGKNDILIDYIICYKI